jgi:hypothetical protein
MRTALLTALLAAGLALSLSAQQPASDKDKKETAPKVLTLTGCVEKSTVPSQYTLTDEQNGKYQVTGNQVGKYVGQRVQVAGTPSSSKFRVKGGLWPTPNVAAQAGAIDPGKAAIAAQPGGGAQGTGDVDLPTLRVRSLRTVDGGCK